MGLPGMFARRPWVQCTALFHRQMYVRSDGNLSAYKIKSLVGAIGTAARGAVASQTYPFTKGRCALLKARHTFLYLVLLSNSEVVSGTSASIYRHSCLTNFLDLISKTFNTTLSVYFTNNLRGSRAICWHLCPC